MDHELSQQVERYDAAERFLGQPLGLWFMRRIDEEIDAAAEGLKTVDPEEPKEIRKLQNNVYKAETLKIWFNEVLIEGRQALDLADSGED